MNGLLAQSAIGFIAINLWEETAWMGFVQARLQARRGMLLGAVLTAALFTLQHLPLFADNGVGVLLIAPVFFALAFPFRALVGWLYNRTNSLFLVGLLHAVGDGTGSGGSTQDCYRVCTTARTVLCCPTSPRHWSGWR